MEKEEKNTTSRTIARDPELLPLIVDRLEALGLTNLEPLAAGNNALVLIDRENDQTIKLSQPSADVWSNKSWERELFKPFDITQHVEHITSAPNEPEGLDGVVIKIAPKMLLISDLPDNEQRALGTEYIDVFSKETGIHTEYKPENIAIITDKNGTPVPATHPDMTYLYAPIDLEYMDIARNAPRSPDFMEDYLKKGVDMERKERFNSTLEKHEPRLRDGGKIQGQDGIIRASQKSFLPDKRY